MKNNRKNVGGFALFEVLFFVLLVAILVGGAYYVGKNHSTKTANNTSSSSSNSAIKTGWHLYTNTAAGYSLQLPAGWSYIKGQAEKDEVGAVVTDDQGNPIISPDSIFPDAEDRQSTNGIAEVDTDTSNLAPKAYFEQNGFGWENYTVQASDSKINDYDAYEAVMTGQGGETHVPVITHNGKVVQFFYYAKPSINKNAAICNEIISTIKFL
jgi:hypothetical protein